MKRLLCIAILCTLCVTLSSCGKADHPSVDPNTDAAAPDVAQQSGFSTLLFSDEFESAAAIDKSGKGKAGYRWYIDRPYGEVPLTKADFTVKDSVLTIAPEKPSCNYAFSTYTKAGDTGFAWQYGYAEARIRMPAENIPSKEDGRIGWPAFWGISLADVRGESWDRCGELDMMECYYDDEKNEVLYSGTIHDCIRTDDGQQRASNAPNANGAYGLREIIDGEWHTYGALWKEGHVSWYVDGVLMHTVEYKDDELPTFYFRELPDPLESKKSATNWESAYTILDKEELVVVLGTDKQWPIEVDWVRIWGNAD